MSQVRIRHTFIRMNLRPRNQIVALGLLGLMIVLIFGGVSLSQVASYAAMYRQTVDLRTERDQLQRKNELLRGEIAGLETIPRLLERAETMGFRPVETINVDHRYLVVQGYNPNRSRTVVPLNTEDMNNQASAYDETFSGWVQQQIDNLRRQFDGFGGTTP
jgi:cell division protein FtsB